MMLCDVMWYFYVISYNLSCNLYFQPLFLAPSDKELHLVSCMQSINKDILFYLFLY